MDNKSHTISLEDWNNSIVIKLIPNSIILMIYLVIGAVGNSVVIYVHIWRMNGNIDDRYFVPALGIVDLIACVINTCISLYANLHPVTYTNDFACKTMWFLAFNSTSASSLMLFVIAVQRYLKVCKPFGQQMTIRYRRIALALLVFLSVLISVPTFFFYGLRDVFHSTGTLGKRCTNVRGPWSKTEPLVFKAVIGLGICIIVVSLIVFYSLIVCVVRKSSKFRKNNHCTVSQSQSMSNFTGEICSGDKKSDSKKQTNTLSIVFLFISVIFIVCYSSKISMMIWESLHENFWIEVSTSEVGIYRFLYTFFIINNIVNPFIYGFFDRRFREEFYRMVPCLRNRSQMYG